MQLQIEVRHEWSSSCRSNRLLGRIYCQRAHEKVLFCQSDCPESRKTKKNNVEVTEILHAEITQPDSNKNCCKNIDAVISTIGITRQKKDEPIYSVMEN